MALIPADGAFVGEASAQGLVRTRRDDDEAFVGEPRPAVEVAARPLEARSAEVEDGAVIAGNHRRGNDDTALRVTRQGAADRMRAAVEQERGAGCDAVGTTAMVALVANLKNAGLDIDESVVFERQCEGRRTGRRAPHRRVVHESLRRRTRAIHPAGMPADEELTVVLEDGIGGEVDVALIPADGAFVDQASAQGFVRTRRQDDETFVGEPRPAVEVAGGDVYHPVRSYAAVTGQRQRARSNAQRLLARVAAQP